MDLDVSGIGGMKLRGHTLSLIAPMKKIANPGSKHTKLQLDIQDPPFDFDPQSVILEFTQNSVIGSDGSEIYI